MACGATLESGRMNRQQPMIWVVCADETQHITPILRLLAVVVGKYFDLIPREIRLTRRAPQHRPRTVARDKITPMLLHFLDAHPGHVMTPRAENARREALLDEISNALVCRVEVFRPDASVVCCPRKTRLVRAARIEGVHVGIESRDDLDDVESLLLPIGRELLKILRPAHPVTKPHPPCIRKPEEGRAIRVLHESPIGGQFQRAACVERICSGVTFYCHFAAERMKSFVALLGTLAAETMRSHNRRRVSRLPDICSRPKRRHAKLPSL